MYRNISSLRKYSAAGGVQLNVEKSPEFRTATEAMIEALNKAKVEPGPRGRSKLRSTFIDAEAPGGGIDTSSPAYRELKQQVVDFYDSIIKYPRQGDLKQ